MPVREKIDVLIPAIEKDLRVLPYVIDGIKRQVKHPIGKIMIVAPKSPKIEQLCRQKGCKFVNENTVLPITKNHIHYRNKRWDRSGWLFQQLLKLGGDRIASQKSFLVMDADTVLIRPHIFKQDGKTVFYCRSWSQPQYFKNYRKLMGKKRSAPTSFVTHYMLFEKSKLASMKKAIEARHGTSWYNAIIRNINKASMFAFSEFETYGNFLYTRNPRKLILKRALNRHLHTDVRTISGASVQKLSAKYRSLSFHARKWYYKKKKAGTR